jgi:hypothetical protein
MTPQIRDWTSCTYKIAGDIEIPTIKCFEIIFSNILVMVVGLAVLALFVMIVVGGFKFLTSGGDPKATASAQQTLTFAMIGIFLMVIAYLIFMLIKAITGVDVTQFTIPG